MSVEVEPVAEPALMEVEEHVESAEAPSHD